MPMTDTQWYALGIIVNSYCYHRERSVMVLSLQRRDPSLLAACKRAFGGKVYHRCDGACTWVLRGKELRAFLDIVPVEYFSR